MVNNEMSEEVPGEGGELAGPEFCPESSAPAEHPDENQLEPKSTTLFCSVPLNRDVQNILDTFPKTETEKTKKVTRKLPCLYCDRTFVADNLRQKHVERIHSIKQARRSSSRFQQSFALTSCFCCDKFTLTENQKLEDLFHHLVVEHSDKYYGCLPCNERFSLLTQLDEHNENNHGLKRELKVQWADRESKEMNLNPIRVGENKIKTRHKAKIKEKGKPEKNLKPKRIALKSTKLGIKRSARLQNKVLQAKLTKKRPKPKERTLIELPENKSEKELKISTSENPYPSFDAFYRVKRITDHSIDNLRITSLTFNDVFDQAFFTRIKCNIRDNLLNHIDGKLFKNQESENRISNFEKTTQLELSNPENNFGCELSLNAATPIATSGLLTAQFSGDDPESQIEYGSKASKKKSKVDDEIIHYKYFTRRKYQASILESKENRDLSKLDMWTQFVIKKRQQKILQNTKSDKEKQDYKKGDEYRAKKQIDELNRILDRRGPFEDLKEEANKKAALEGNFNQEAHAEVTTILEDILEGVLSKVAVKEKIEMKPIITPDTVIPSYLNLREASLCKDSYVDKSDKITLICSSEETENFEESQSQPKDKNALVELTGEWARSRLYICAACGLKLPNMRLLLDHKNFLHQNVWCQHYEFVGNQGQFYKHLSIPGLGKMSRIEENSVNKSWKRSEARICTKCQKQCNSLGELHRHILECGEDWSWMLVRKKCKYKPYGAKTRRKRRGLFKRIIHKEKSTDENREKKIYKKIEGPRPKPSDAETIQRMLANLPAKRASRKIICMKDGFPRVRKKAQIKQIEKNSMVKHKRMVRRSRAELLIQDSNKILKRKIVSGKKCNPVANLRKSMRNLNKVISTKLIDNNKTLMIKRKLKAVMQEQRITRQSPQQTPEPKEEDNSTEVKKKVGITNKIKFFKKNMKKIKKDEEPELKNPVNEETKVPEEEIVEVPKEIKKKVRKKQNIGAKLVRTLSLRKTNKAEEVNEEKVEKTEEEAKVGEKRKSRLDRFRSVVKKIKLARKKESEEVKEVVEAVQKVEVDATKIVGGHFLEEGANGPDTITINSNELKDSEKLVFGDFSVLKPSDNSVIKTEEPVIKPISDLKPAENVLPKLKGKLCKRAKGLNACIAMLTSKLQQKEDFSAIPNNHAEVVSIKAKEETKINDQIASIDQEVQPAATPTTDLLPTNLSPAVLIPETIIEEAKLPIELISNEVDAVPVEEAHTPESKESASQKINLSMETPITQTESENIKEISLGRVVDIINCINDMNQEEINAVTCIRNKKPNFKIGSVRKRRAKVTKIPVIIKEKEKAIQETMVQNLTINIEQPIKVFESEVEISNEEPLNLVIKESEVQSGKEQLDIIDRKIGQKRVLPKRKSKLTPPIIDEDLDEILEYKEIPAKKDLSTIIEVPSYIEPLVPNITLLQKENLKQTRFTMTHKETYTQITNFAAQGEADAEILKTVPELIENNMADVINEKTKNIEPNFNEAIPLLIEQPISSLIPVQKEKQKRKRNIKKLDNAMPNEIKENKLDETMKQLDEFENLDGCLVNEMVNEESVLTQNERPKKEKIESGVIKIIKTKFAEMNTDLIELEPINSTAQDEANEDLELQMKPVESPKKKKRASRVTKKNKLDGINNRISDLLPENVELVENKPFTLNREQYELTKEEYLNVAYKELAEETKEDEEVKFINQKIEYRKEIARRNCTITNISVISEEPIVLENKNMSTCEILNEKYKTADDSDDEVPLALLLKKEEPQIFDLQMEEDQEKSIKKKRNSKKIHECLNEESLESITSEKSKKTKAKKKSQKVEMNGFLEDDAITTIEKDDTCKIEASAEEAEIPITSLQVANESPNIKQPMNLVQILEKQANTVLNKDVYDFEDLADNNKPESISNKLDENFAPNLEIDLPLDTSLEIKKPKKRGRKKKNADEIIRIDDILLDETIKFKFDGTKKRGRKKKSGELINNKMLDRDVEEPLQEPFILSPEKSNEEDKSHESSNTLQTFKSESENIIESNQKESCEEYQNADLKIEEPTDCFPKIEIEPVAREDLKETKTQLEEKISDNITELNQKEVNTMDFDENKLTIKLEFSEKTNCAENGRNEADLKVCLNLEGRELNEEPQEGWETVNQAPIQELNKFSENEEPVNNLVEVEGVSEITEIEVNSENNDNILWEQLKPNKRGHKKKDISDDQMELSRKQNKQDRRKNVIHAGPKVADSNIFINSENIEELESEELLEIKKIPDRRKQLSKENKTSDQFLHSESLKEMEETIDLSKKTVKEAKEDNKNEAMQVDEILQLIHDLPLKAKHNIPLNALESDSAVILPQSPLPVSSQTISSPPHNLQTIILQGEFVNETINDNSKENFVEKKITKRTKKLSKSDNEIENEICLTPLKDNKNTENEASFIHTPDLNDSDLNYKLHAKLKVKGGIKTKKLKSKKIQEDEDNFCSICKKRFVRNDSLIKHKRTLTHIAKLSEIEAKEAAEKKSKATTKKSAMDEKDTLEVELEENSSKNPEYANDITNNILVTSPFSIKTNNDTLKLADIISDVLNKPVSTDDMDTFTDILQQKSETFEAKRYKSLGERKSFDSDSVMYNSNQTSTYPEHKISSDTLLEKQISLLENIIQENKASFQYIDEMSVDSNKSDDRCPSDMSLVSDIKPDDSNIICTVGTVPEDNFVKPMHYEEISEDTHNFEEQRARKALNRDEELFLECCSLLKSSSEMSNYSKKSSMVNNYRIKSDEEWLENKSAAISKPKCLSENSCPGTPISDSYEDFSNSNTIKTDWNMRMNDQQFEDISLDSVSHEKTSFNHFQIEFHEKKDKRVVESSGNEDSKLSDILVEEGEEHQKNINNKFVGLMTEVLKSKNSNNSTKLKMKDTTQTAITDYTVPIPKKSETCDSFDPKKMLTKGAMKVFEGLKVSIPTQELDMNEVLNCSPTSKRLEIEAIEAIKERPRIAQVKQSKENLKKFGNKLGLKITKKRMKNKIEKEDKKRDGENKIHDIYDFEETLDNTDVFVPNNLRTFRSQLGEKNRTDSKGGESDSECPPPKDPESDVESNNQYLDSFGAEAQSVSSFSTGTESTASIKKNTGMKNITKKKCMIMGRIFKNAFKSKSEDVRDIPPIDNEKLVENYVKNCPGIAASEKVGSGIKMTEQEMDILFDKLLEDQKEEKVAKPVKVTNLPKKVNTVTKNNKSKVTKQKKRVRKHSQSSDDDFNLSKISKKRTVRKKRKEKDNSINLEQELKECIGVAGRKTQRKCTSGKQNVLVEYWSSDDSEFEAMLQLSMQVTKPATVREKIKETPVVQSEIKEILKPVEGEIQNKIETEDVIEQNEVFHEVKKSKMDGNKPKGRRKSGAMDKIKSIDTVATNRRKRSAAETLYYWSSSSEEDDSQNLIEIKSIRDEIEDEDDRPMQHGWIVGDSPKKLVTMLAQAKGKKIDPKSVKEQTKKRTTV